MKRKVLLIVNPVSGKMKAKGALAEIVSILNRGDCQVTVEITSHRGHATEIAREAAGDYDILVCCGGDGTLNELVRGILESGVDVPIGYIPSGSTNDFAGSIGLSSDIQTAARAIVTGEPHAIDIGQFKEAYFTYIASFGAFTSASYSAPQSAKNVLGHSAYILEGIKDLNTIKPVHMQVTANGTTYDNSYIFGGVANSTSVGGIVKLKPELVDMSDGLFEVLLIKNLRNLNDFNHVVKSILTSDYESNDVIDYFKASEVTFAGDGEVPWTLDGEYMDGSGTFTVRNLKQKLTILK